MNAFILAGATATGKTAVCQHLAERMGAAILSTDSMLAYKGMDIGTAKPSPDEQRRVTYLGLDLFEPDETASVGMWVHEVRRQLAGLPSGQPLIVTGGSGFYLDALLNPLDAAPSTPESRARWEKLFEQHGLVALQNALRERLAPEVFAAIPDFRNPRRLIRLLERHDAGEDITFKPKPSKPRVPALDMPRGLLHKRAAERVRAMVANGLLDEVRALRDRPAWSATARAAIGYAEFAGHLDGTLELQAAVTQTVARTRRLAKRQYAWIRHQMDPIWIMTTPGEPLPTLAGRVMEAWEKLGPVELKTDAPAGNN
ncbi:MAG: tRNA (adenosine(37)-N6)-dimethylallyltransferase MiaA [Kiritimatiellaeota bacterium]|nr:tRNA (adenosine(37)-N6)-dimethylallyltransferase MiaA [Kiritimatiellota bacterium]